MIKDKKLRTICINEKWIAFAWNRGIEEQLAPATISAGVKAPASLVLVKLTSICSTTNVPTTRGYLPCRLCQRLLAVVHFFFLEKSRMKRISWSEKDLIFFFGIFVQRGIWVLWIRIFGDEKSSLVILSAFLSLRFWKDFSENMRVLLCVRHTFSQTEIAFLHPLVSLLEHVQHAVGRINGRHFLCQEKYN